MASQYVVGDSMSPFMKRVLIPFWVARIVFMLIDIAVYSVVIAAIITYSEQREDYSDVNLGTVGTINAALAVAAVILTLIVLCLVLDIVCIVKRARRTLAPRFFLVVNVIQTTFWTIMFALGMVGTHSGASIALGVLLLLSFLGLLIYASVIFHRHRKGALKGSYAHATSDPQSQGLVQQGGYPAYPAHPANPFDDQTYPAAQPYDPNQPYSPDQFYPTNQRYDPQPPANEVSGDLAYQKPANYEMSFQQQANAAEEYGHIV